MSNSPPRKSAQAEHIQKNTMDNATLEKEILNFLNDASSKPGTTDKPGCPLNHGLACVLCTVNDSLPRATPIDFFVDGMILWLAGEPGLKIRNIRSNPKVAVGVYHPVDHSQLNRSLQISGTATLITFASDKEVFVDRLKKMGVYDAARKFMLERFTAQGTPLTELDQEAIKVLQRFNLIKVEPDEITYLHIHPTEGTQKNIWKKTKS